MSDAAIIQGQLVDARNVGVHKSFRLVVDVPAEQAAMVIERLGWPTQANPIPVAIARLDLSKIGGNEVANGEALSLSCPGLASPSIHEGEAAGPSTLAAMSTATASKDANPIRRGEPSPDKPLKERKPTKLEDRLKLRAALLCSAPAFWTFLSQKGVLVSDAEGAANYVRHICGVASRRQIVPGTLHGDVFERLYSDFTIWRDHPELVAS